MTALKPETYDWFVDALVRAHRSKTFDVAPIAAKRAAAAPPLTDPAAASGGLLAFANGLAELVVVLDALSLVVFPLRAFRGLFSLPLLARLFSLPFYD